MNIFKILSSNDGSINEPNVSSFLAYLLDPNENHGLGSRFVESVLSAIVLSNPDKYKDLIYDGRIRDLSRNSMYEVRIQAEVKVISFESDSKRRTRDIDILIEIFDRTSMNGLPKFSFCIENKIKDGAILKGDSQLFEEIIGLKNYYNGPPTNEQPKISFIFLTPSYSKVANDEFNELINAISDELIAIPCYHLTWRVGEEESRHFSIVHLLTRILAEEASGKIEPIYEYTKHTIKSFISFINSGFQSYSMEKVITNEKTDYGKPVIQYIKDFYDFVSSNKDVEHDYLKRWVTEKIKETSGKTIKNANFDRAYIVNERNRKHYGVNSPYKLEKNLFYYPDDSNKKIIRKLDFSNLPPIVYIYWKDVESIDNLGSALITDVYSEMNIEKESYRQGI